MRIDEAEGVVLRQRDAPARRRHRRIEPRGRAVRRHGELLDRIDIEMMLGHVGEMFEPRGEVRVLAGLHQAEMALGQRQRSIARDRAEHGNVEGGDRLRHQPHMPLAADAVQHHPADPHVTLVGGEAAHHGRRRLRLPGDVDDQQHRQAEPRGEIGRRPGPERRRGDAVEQAHGALDDEKVGMRGVLGHQRIDQRRRHGPAVEIEAWPPGRRGMKARVDIVGPDLGRLHHDAAPAERRQQRQRQRGLAARPSAARQR